MDSSSSQIVQSYQIIRELGRNREGGRITYLAQSLATEQQVVIKQFRFLQTDATWNGFKAYEREITMLQTLNHPRIPRYLDSLETEDGFCLIQEFKDAPSLAEKSTYSPEDIQKIALSILDILIDLQNYSPVIIHRDLKPENILVDGDLNVYLIDFGLARLQHQEVAISSIAGGTPGFMPPEEVFNRSLTTASDLYSLGATLIALLSQTPSTKISDLLDENYRFSVKDLISGVNPRFLDWLATIVEPNPRERYANAAIAKEKLNQIDITALGTPIKRYYWLFYPWVAMSFVSLVMGLVMGGWLWMQPQKSPSPVQLSVINPSSDAPSASPAQQWYSQIKPHCNAVEVLTAMNASPPPQTTEGMGFAAACYALAGKIEQAHQLIQKLPPQDRFQAAGIVFAIGHPVADAGDDKSAGPIMEFVIQYQPENFMALYHAGMSQYVLGEWEMSQKNLKSFLNLYQNDDGWRNNAIEVLERIENRK